MLPSLSLLPSLPPCSVSLHALPRLGGTGGASEFQQLRCASGLPVRRRWDKYTKAAYSDSDSFGQGEAAGGRSAGGSFSERYSIGGSRKGGRSRSSDDGGGGRAWRGGSRDEDSSYGSGRQASRGGRGGGRGGGRFQSDRSSRGGGGRGSGGRGGGRDWRDDSSGGGRGGGYQRDRTATSYGSERGGRGGGSGRNGGRDWAGRGGRSGRSSFKRDNAPYDSQGEGASSYGGRGQGSYGAKRSGGRSSDASYSGFNAADYYNRSSSGSWIRADDEPGPLSKLKEAWQGDALYGIAPVLAALAGGRRTAHALYIQEGKEGRDQKAVRDAIAAAEAAGVPVNHASKHDLNMMCDSRPHQGLVLDCSPLGWEELDRLPPADNFAAGPPPVWLALDEVQDPMNFGAALRCAHFLGAAGVLACDRNAAPLSPVVSKASAGALEAMTMFSARNLPRTLAAAGADGWIVLGAAAEGDAADVLDFQLDRPAVLVVGSEGAGVTPELTHEAMFSGLRTNVKRACSQLIRIGGGSSSSGAAAPTERWSVDSLNVSVATGILLHQLIASARQSGQGIDAAAGSGAAHGLHKLEAGQQEPVAFGTEV